MQVVPPKLTMFRCWMRWCRVKASLNARNSALQALAASLPGSKFSGFRSGPIGFGGMSWSVREGISPSGIFSLQHRCAVSRTNLLIVQGTRPSTLRPSNTVDKSAWYNASYKGAIHISREQGATSSEWAKQNCTYLLKLGSMRSHEVNLQPTIATIVWPDPITGRQNHGFVSRSICLQ